MRKYRAVLAVSRPSKCGCPQRARGSNPTASRHRKKSVIKLIAGFLLFSTVYQDHFLFHFLSRRDFFFYSLDAHDKVHIVKLSSFSAYNKEYNRRIPSFCALICAIFEGCFEQNSLAQSITLDIIFDRNNVIFKRWHYAETYKTDKSIFEYESNRVRRTT